MYGKPGSTDDWKREIERYHRDQKEARNARFVFGCLFMSVIFFMPYIIVAWPE